MAEKYLLRVTAGPDYDESTHVVLPTNTETPTTITSSYCTAKVTVRVQNYRGLPRQSPETSPYFSNAEHQHDMYSIGFDFVPFEDISGENLVFGNDFDRPIRDRLPPGFGTAFRIVKWWVDPGLEGDVYADKPYLYGPALSSLNVLRVGDKATGEDKKSWSAGEGQKETGVEEGGDGSGVETREQYALPDSAADRKKWALTEENRRAWQWEAGRVYRADFFNPYLDFNNFALKLPGFAIDVLKYMDGKDSLRYVLKDKETGKVFFVVVFTLVLKDDIEKEESGTTDTSEASGEQPKDDDLD